ncbi:MAG: macro domain-containing protein [Oscillospiraceae bacterium]|nr:macro domain-containing protein [Oscillospiraceae bacterium]
MIEYKKGDLLASGTEAIVNTVNCVGVMGRGIALQFKKQFPGNYTFYESACKHNEVMPGKMLVYEINRMLNPRYIINFPTKRHWRGASRIEDIEAGLVDLIGVIKERGITSIAIPPLGCGLGGLEWREIKPRIETAFAGLPDVNVALFEPDGAPPAEEMARNRKVPNMTSGRAALVCLTKRYLDGLLDPFVTLLEIHKLMYFLQESGEPMRLKYVKAPYGPYAENLSHVLNAVEGYLLTGYADGGDKPDKQIQIVPGADKDAMDFLEKQPETTNHINRVAELVDGYETPFGMELLATVHWVAKNEVSLNLIENSEKFTEYIEFSTRTATMQDIVDCVYAWGAQKRKFSQRQIKTAFDRLMRNGWLTVSDEL